MYFYVVCSCASDNIPSREAVKILMMKLLQYIDCFICHMCVYHASAARMSCIFRPRQGRKLIEKGKTKLHEGIVNHLNYSKYVYRTKINNLDKNEKKILQVKNV